jgi:hypothetical protein
VEDGAGVRDGAAVDESAGAARLLLLASAAAALLLFAASTALALQAEPARAFLLAHGREHSPGAAALFVRSLRAALAAEGAFAALLALLAQLRLRGHDLPVRALAAFTCGLAAAVGAGGLLFTAPVELLEGPFPLAEALIARAGPSADRWRIDADPGASVSLGDLDWRTGLVRWMSQSLVTQYNAQAGVDSVAVYSSVEDRDYLAAWQRAPQVMSSLFGVRFSMRSPFNLKDDEARSLGYQQLPPGIWVREEPPQPRAFLVTCANVAKDAAEAVRMLTSAGLDPHRAAALTGGQALPCDSAAAARELDPPVALTRPAPERMELSAAPARASLLVVGEHFDPGWSATLDGAPAPVLQADLAALAVRVPAGPHRVVLRFWPRGLTAGLALAAAALLLLAIYAARDRARSRTTRSAA